MQSYIYRSVKAIAEYRYPQVHKNRNAARPVAPYKVWHAEIWQASTRPNRRQRANNRAPNRSRAA